MDPTYKKILPHRMFNKLATKTKNYNFGTIRAGKVDEPSEHDGCDVVKLQQAVG